MTQPGAKYSNSVRIKVLESDYAKVEKRAKKLSPEWPRNQANGVSLVLLDLLANAKMRREMLIRSGSHRIVNIRMHANLHGKLKERAKDSGMTLGKYCAAIISLELAE